MLFCQVHEGLGITFNLDQAKYHLPSSTAFHVVVVTKNLVIHYCIIDEGASTSVMSFDIWNSLELMPSIMTLCACDGFPSQP